VLLEGFLGAALRDREPDNDTGARANAQSENAAV
jgi:hypothetical protein